MFRVKQIIIITSIFLYIHNIIRGFELVDGESYCFDLC